MLLWQQRQVTGNVASSAPAKLRTVMGHLYQGSDIVKILYTASKVSTGFRRTDSQRPRGRHFATRCQPHIAAAAHFRRIYGNISRRSPLEGFLPWTYLRRHDMSLADVRHRRKRPKPTSQPCTLSPATSILQLLASIQAGPLLRRLHRISVILFTDIGRVVLHSLSFSHAFPWKVCICCPV